MPNLLTIDLDELTTEEKNLIYNILNKDSHTLNPASVFASPFMFASGSGVYFPLYWSVPPEVNFIYSVGNIYGNKANAEFALEREKVLAKLRDLSISSFHGIPDWHDDSRKYSLEYNTRSDVVSYDWWSETAVCSSRYLFATCTDAYNAINTIGEDRLKKYYFEIE